MGNKTFSNELLHSDRTVPITHFFCVTETYFAQGIHTLLSVYFDVAFFVNCEGGLQLELLFFNFIIIIVMSYNLFNKSTAI